MVLINSHPRVAVLFDALPVIKTCAKKRTSPRFGSHRLRHDEHKSQTLRQIWACANSGAQTD
jgi:hypothetical protein